jgi:hypothetical protein
MVHQSTCCLSRVHPDGEWERELTTSYLTVIKQPMDLATAQAKLSNGLYTTRQDFVKDIRQMYV